MSVDIFFDTSRLDALIRNLDPLTAAGLDEVGKDLESENKTQVTAMDVVDTGRLRDSTKWKHLEPLAGVVAVEATSDEGADYPIFQHEGWTGRTGNWHPGRPFLRVALENTRRRVPLIFQNVFRGRYGVAN